MSEKLEFRKNFAWKSREDFLDASDETLEKWRLQSIENDEFNGKIQKEMAAKLEDAKRLVMQIWGQGSNQVAYLTKARRDLPHVNNQLSMYNSHITYRAEQLEKKKKEDEKRKKHDDKIRTLCEIANRHNLDKELGVYALIDELLKKDKYLDLAYAMLQTRNDWMGGFYRVYSALNRFAVVDDIDNEICANIKECLESDETDGRIFRDTEWSYNRIFELANNILHEDLMTLYELTWS